MLIEVRGHNASIGVSEEIGHSPNIRDEELRGLKVELVAKLGSGHNAKICAPAEVSGHDPNKGTPVGTGGKVGDADVLTFNVKLGTAEVVGLEGEKESRGKSSSVKMT